MNPTVKKLLFLKGLWQFILMQSVAVAFFKSRSMDSQQIFWLQSIFLATICLLDVPSSILTEKWGLKYSLLIGCLFKALGGMTLLIESSVKFVFLSYVLIGIGNAFYSGVDYTLLFNSVSHGSDRNHQLKKLQGLAHSIALFAILTSGLLGAWVAQYFGLRTLIIGNATIAWSSFFLALTIRDDQRPVNLTSKYGSQVFKEALAITFSSERRPNVFLLVLVGVVAVLFPYLLQLRVGDENLGPVILGNLFAFQNGLGGILGAVFCREAVARWVTVLSRPIFVIALCAFSLSLLYWGNLAIFALSVFAIETARAVVAVMVSSNFHMSFSQASRPTVSSIVSMTSRLVAILLTSVLGVISKSYSIAFICAALGGLIMLSLVDIRVFKGYIWSEHSSSK
jgi:MFS family permease